jgi:hypothetical protein
VICSRRRDMPPPPEHRVDDTVRASSTCGMCRKVTFLHLDKAAWTLGHGPGALSDIGGPPRSSVGSVIGPSQKLGLPAPFGPAKRQRVPEDDLRAHSVREAGLGEARKPEFWLGVGGMATILNTP